MQNKQERTSLHGLWSSRWAYILAATGSAVGLGNIWKFPYITGEHGGGAFVLFYLFCILLIGVPVLMAEVLIGRRGRRMPASSIQHLAIESKVSKHWSVIGWLGMTTGFLILTFYVVIAGWALAYVKLAGLDSFHQLSAQQVDSIFSALSSDPVALIAWSSIILLITMVIVGRGVQHGLERAVSYLMPMMFFILVIIVGYSMSTSGFERAVDFLFTPNWSELTASGALVALGHSCFTLSLASGIMMMYGAYLPNKTSIVKTSLFVAFADTFIALLAGLAIFPIVFSNGLEAGAGPGLIFVTLPIAFGQMPFGHEVGTLFFVMLVFAALTSAISLIEAVVAWLVERTTMTRIQAATLAGLTVWLLSLGTVFSLSTPEAVSFSLDILGLELQGTFFEFLDYITANIMLPLGALLIAVFTAWILKSEVTADEIKTHSLLYMTWKNLMRYLAPAAITLVFLNALGVI